MEHYRHNSDDFDRPGPGLTASQVKLAAPRHTETAEAVCALRESIGRLEMVIEPLAASLSPALRPQTTTAAQPSPELSRRDGSPLSMELREQQRRIEMLHNHLVGLLERIDL